LFSLFVGGPDTGKFHRNERPNQGTKNILPVKKWRGESDGTWRPHAIRRLENRLAATVTVFLIFVRIFAPDILQPLKERANEK
jgi:hypothetical protein